jgi:PilZ domain-containing protein
MERLQTEAMIEDQRPGQAVLTNNAERRKSPRTSIRRLAYVNLDPYDNGGVITDISRDGLRFHLVNPVEQGGIVRLSILLESVNQLRVIGELVWLDATRKVGGVRFTVLPDGAADQILSWAEASNNIDISNARRDGKVHVHAHSDVSEPSSQCRADGANSNSARPQTQSSAASVPQAAQRLTSPAQSGAESGTRSTWVPPSLRAAAGADAAEARAASSQNPQSMPQAWRKPEPHAPMLPPAMPWIAHFDPDPPARGTSFVRGLLGGFVLCVLLGFAIWVAFQRYGWPDLQSPLQSPTVSHSVPSNSAASDPQLPAPAPYADSNTAQIGARAEGAPSFTPNASVPDALSGLGQGPRQDPAGTAAGAAAPATRPQSAAAPQVVLPAESAPLQPRIAGPVPGSTLSTPNGSPANPSQNAVRLPASQVSRSADAGETQLMLARQYLDGRVQPRNPLVASQLLWAAVEKGNSAAEMDLADLYLHGDGVARNCDQARILLSVASEKGNPEALQKLRELNRAGCR